MRTERRTKRVELRFTNDEYDLIAEMARIDHSKGIATWIHQTVMNRCLVTVVCPSCGHADLLADNGWTAVLCRKCGREIRRTDVGS